MAKAPEKQEEPAIEAPPPKSKSKIFVMGGIGLLVLLILGGAGFFFLKKTPKPEADEAKIEHAKKIKLETAPIIVKLDQFTVKLQPDEGRPEQYMQAVVELEVIDNQSAERVKSFMSKIRANVLMLLLAKTPSDLSTPQGVEKLSAEIRNMINQILDGGARPPNTMKAGPDDSVQAVYLTQFIIQ
jgi:flagellar FliL protein